MSLYVCPGYYSKDLLCVSCKSAHRGLIITATEDTHRVKDQEQPPKERQEHTYFLGQTRLPLGPGVPENTQQIKSDYDFAWQLWQCQQGGLKGEPGTKTAVSCWAAKTWSFSNWPQPGSRTSHTQALQKITSVNCKI